jgi:WD40 repeat protein
LAFPDEQETGFVMVLSTVDFQTKRRVCCHTSAIRLLQSVEDGTFLTASGKGTLIRVFNSNTGDRIAEFRRGYKPASIVALAGNSQIRVACSETTIHIFHESYHVKISPTSPPLSCFVCDRAVCVVGLDGTLSSYLVGPTDTAELTSEIRVGEFIEKPLRKSSVE